MTSAAVSTVSEFPRRFVAPDDRFTSWGAAEPYYQALLTRPVNTAAELERWLMDWSEVDSIFEEEGTDRYIRMTCDTTDAERERMYLDFVENIKPKREPITHKLDEKLVDLARRFDLPQRRYEVLMRSARNSVALFRDENIPLYTEDDKLRQQYQKICAAMTVKYDGQEMTLQQVARYLEEPDRSVRETTWRLAADRFLADGDALDGLYDQMVRLRTRIARNADCRNYQEFAFKAMERFDYTPDDCARFHDTIESVIVPAVGQILKERREALKLDALRPWDLSVDPHGRAPLRPFKTDAELSRGCQEIFNRVEPELGAVYATMAERGMLDLASRKGKAPGGYQANYDERRIPFIFMNAVGTEGDVRTLLHEGGHAFHTWACRNDTFLSYRHYPTEFAEVASMGMECLALPHLETFYGPETNRARKRFFEEILLFFPWMARVDAFQHHVYTHTDLTPEQRKDHWQKLTRRYSPSVDWSGLEAYDRRSWHRKLHFFEVPFYYVEYGIAQLGALQVWLNSKRDFRAAVAAYRHGLALGGSRPLPELFEAAGCRFDFSEKTVRPLIQAVMEELAGL